MTSTSQRTFYARPVFLGGEDKKSQSYQKQTAAVESNSKSSKSVTFLTPKNGRILDKTGSGRRLPDRNDTSNGRVHISDIDNLVPPPRPPPPRPKRVPKPGQLTHDGHSASQSSLGSPEPKPLTRTNVTDHDRLWKREEDEEERMETGPFDVLTPPLQFITPQSTEEMLKNFDPLEGIDSTSDHSDSSADTMIMMTSEEEKRNMERINHSLSQYTSVKSKGPETGSTNKLKVDIQSKQFQIPEQNGYSSLHGTSLFTKGLPQNDMHNFDNVYPLHIKTDSDNNTSSPESERHKDGSQHGSPNDDSPDDGYGTNSSSGTVSSPFSSSFGSSDLDHSCNGPFKKPLLPNGAIKPNSVRESWAVKRKQRMIEASDNSVQEQLRQLTIIEEESGGQQIDGGHHRLQPSQQTATGRRSKRYGMNVSQPQSVEVNKVDQNLVLRKDDSNENSNFDLDLDRSDGQGHRSEVPFVNVSSGDLARHSGQLYVMDSTSPQVHRRHGDMPLRTPPVPPHLSPNEINPPRVPPHRHSNHSGNISSGNGERIYDQVYEPQSVLRSVPDPSNTVSDSASINSDASYNEGRPVLRGGSEMQRTLSGKIYVSPTGDEGFYSLNRSSRSTSVSSFQQANESIEYGYFDELAPDPQTPLEAMSGDMLEKWSEMDINYRNYYGFGDESEKFSRTDSKINYFQEKKINTLYGQDNYYRPANYDSEVVQTLQGHISAQAPVNQGSVRDLRQEVPSRATQETTSRSSSVKSQKGSKSSKDSGTKSKLFQILPNMFKPSKKQNTDSKNKPKLVISNPSVVVQTNIDKHKSLDLTNEAEYINIGDLPQYSVASVVYEDKLKKGQFVSLDTLLHKRPVFASSKDINKLFSHHDQSFDSIHHPGAQRHSFHAMPLSYRHVAPDTSGSDSMRPRAQSTSAAVRNQQVRMSVENRMSLIAHKNAAVMNQARQVAGSNSNISVHSSSSNQRLGSSRVRLDSGSSGGDQRLGSSRVRLDSGSSGGDSKLSTLV